MNNGGCCKNAKCKDTEEGPKCCCKKGFKGDGIDNCTGKCCMHFYAINLLTQLIYLLFLFIIRRLWFSSANVMCLINAQSLRQVVSNSNDTWGHHDPLTGNFITFLLFVNSRIFISFLVLPLAFLPCSTHFQIMPCMYAGWPQNDFMHLCRRHYTGNRALRPSTCTLYHVIISQFGENMARGTTTMGAR